MDEYLFSRLKQKQDEVKPLGPDEKFKDRVKDMQKQIPDRMKNAEEYVENSVFSGEAEQLAELQGDVSHNYVFESMKQSVEASNKLVAEKIKAFGHAELQKGEKLKKTKETELLKPAVNAAAKEATGKDKSDEDALLKDIRKTQNSKADLSTVREILTLQKYNGFYEKYRDYVNLPSEYLEILADEAKKYEKANPKLFTGLNKVQKDGKKEEKRKEEKRKELHYNLSIGAMPFMKTYTKGFLGVFKYDMDGKRIKTKKGELEPDAYNKRLLKALALETDKGKVDNKTLEANRAEKAVVLAELTEELLAMAKKLKPEMLSDAYLADHIGEMQQYWDKLKAYHFLAKKNMWFFLGNDDAADPKTKRRKPDDPAFWSLVNTRIFRVGDELSLLMNHHYRAHGIYRGGKEQKTIREGFWTDPNWKESIDILDADYDIFLEEQQQLFIYDFSIVQERQKTPEEQAAYQKKVEAARLTLPSTRYTAIKEMQELNGRHLKQLGDSVNKIISDGMKELKKESDKLYKEEGYDKNKCAKLPFDQYAGRSGGLLLYDMKEKFSKSSRLIRVLRARDRARLFASVRVLPS